MANEITPISTSNTLSAIKAISDLTTPITSASTSAATTQDAPELAALQKLGSGVQYAQVMTDLGTDDATGGHLYLLELTNKQTLTVNSNVELATGQMVAFQATQSQLRLVAAVEATESQLINQLVNQLSTQQDSQVTGLALLQALVKTPNASPQLTELLKLAPNLAKAAAELTEQLPQLPDLRRAETVKNNIANSGVFFENKLANASGPDELERIFASDVKAILGKISAELKNNPALQEKLNQLTNNKHPAASTSQAVTNKPVLIPAVQTESIDLPTATASLSAYTRVAAASPSLPSKPNATLLPQVLPPLAGMPGMQFHPPAPVKSAADIGDALVAVLFRNTQTSLNRITLQQLANTKRSERSETDEDTPSAIRINLDIPFFFQNAAHAINLRIEGEPDRHSEKIEPKKRVSIWNITLAFDLDFIGPMQIQLRINDTLANATIWAEREQTLLTTRNAVDELKTSLSNIGLNVASIDCKPGLPTFKGAPVEHRLVDVKT